MAKREFIEYFGKRTKSFPDGNKLTRENLVSEQNKAKGLNMWYKDDALQDHLDEIAKPFIENALLSYDINMRYFAQLKESEFRRAVSQIVKEFNMERIYNLKDFNERAGIYMIVLGEYKSFYIGQSNDISKRISSHWSRSMEVWRLVFGPVTESILSIDAFRAHDTTEIYFMPYFILYGSLLDMEEIVTAYVMRKKLGKFMINRLMGGNTNVDFQFRGDERNRLQIVVTDDDRQKAREIMKMFEELDEYHKSREEIWGEMMS